MKFLFKERLQSYLNTARELFVLDGRVDLAEVLQSGVADVEFKTGYDNWDGGQYFHTLIFKVPLLIFHKVSSNLASNAEKIKDMINKVANDLKNESLESVNILVDNSMDRTIFSLDRLSKGKKVYSAFDEYTLIEKIGQGGNGVVFAATGKDDVEYAIKFFNTELSTLKFKRFKNEIWFCERCSHQNIVHVVDHGCINVGGEKYSFYVMPRYEKSLRDKIKEGISPVDAVSIFLGILKGLEFAHKQRVVHRDIKPENIMFAKGSNNPIICDFGIAHIPLDLEATTVVTQPIDRMANWNYASPEQRIKGVSAVPQSDIYSAALILNEMFTTEVPTSVGYKRISDVAPQYRYLDDVFDQIYRQRPEERLYPEDVIVSQIKIRGDIQKNEDDKSTLEKINFGETNISVKALHILNTIYKNDALLVDFDVDIPDEWLRLLKQGSFDHRFLLGCGPQKFEKYSKRTLVMPVPYNMEIQSIKETAEHIKNWVSSVNKKYEELVICEEKQKQKQIEADLKKRITRLNRENEINEMLLRR